MKHVLKMLLRALVGGLFRVRVRGDGRGLDASRLLVVANHESFLDGLLLGLFLPIEPVFVVHTGVAKNIWFRLIVGPAKPLRPSASLVLAGVLPARDS